LQPNVELGAFVVMPNHFHAIIQITRRGEIHAPVESRRGELHSPPELHSPMASRTVELHSHIRIRVPVRGPSQTVGAIIRGYKSAVTRQLGLNGGLWQRNYYESIIRDEISCIFL
jgi:REP element-mobilizing transposase RayT